MRDSVRTLMASTLSGIWHYPFVIRTLLWPRRSCSECIVLVNSTLAVLELHVLCISSAVSDDQIPSLSDRHEQRVIEREMGRRRAEGARRLVYAAGACAASLLVAETV